MQPKGNGSISFCANPARRDYLAGMLPYEMTREDTEDTRGHERTPTSTSMRSWPTTLSRAIALEATILMTATDPHGSRTKVLQFFHFHASSEHHAQCFATLNPAASSVLPLDLHWVKQAGSLGSQA